MKKKSYADRGKLGDFYFYKIHQPIWFLWHKQLYPRLKGYKPLMSENRYRKIGQRLQEMQFGQLVLNKFMAIITIMNTVILISVKWDFDPTYYLVPIGVLVGFMIWYIGHVLEKKGVRKYYREAEFKDVRLK